MPLKTKKHQHKQKIENIYSWLLKSYGPQGWWPVMSHEGGKPDITGDLRGYHPGVYSYPKNDNQRFEICVGAVLTQNTAWKNVEKALVNLQTAGMLCAQKLIRLDDVRLKELIRPAGYYNQKAGYLRCFTELYISLRGRIPGRDELLSCRGVGEETADSMLLYAFSQPEFVVDAYTRRIFSHLGFCTPDEKYGTIKALFENALEKDLVVFQEYHALIVEHAKRQYFKKPYGKQDPLKSLFKKRL